MNRKPLALGITAASTVALAALLAQTPSGAARPAAKKRLLIVTTTTGFRHDSIPLARDTIKALGEKGGWDADVVDIAQEEYNKPDTRDKIAKLLGEKMSPEALKGYDGVVFANTTGVLPLPDPQAFLDYVKSGKGFVAMHSGSDTFHEWPGGAKDATSEYIKMLGG